MWLVCGVLKLKYNGLRQGDFNFQPTPHTSPCHFLFTKEVGVEEYEMDSFVFALVVILPIIVFWGVIIIGWLITR